MYKIKFSKLAAKDAKKLKKVGLDNKAKNLISILKSDPLANIPPHKKLCGNLKGTYSRRINIKHRLVCEIDIKNKIVYILRMWSHYE